MNRSDDDLQARFDRRLAGIEAEIPKPGAWTRPDDEPAGARSSHPGGARFAAAGVTAVALMLVGMLLVTLLSKDHAAPQPGSSDALVSSLETVGIEPGVVRALSDGYRSLTWDPEADPVYEDVGAGDANDRESRVQVLPDGRVFLFHSGGHFELGDPGTHLWPGTEFMTLDDQVFVSGEGVPFKWVGWRPESWSPMHTGELWTFVDGAWRKAVLPFGPDGLLGPSAGLAADPEGDVWAIVGKHGVFSQGPDGWQLEMEAPSVTRDSVFHVDRSGTLWQIGPALSVGHSDGGEWQHASLLGLTSDWPGGGQPLNSIHVGNVSDDGVVWVHVRQQEPTGPEPFLARFADGLWTTFGLTDGVPAAVGDDLNGSLEVAADGSVWLNPGDLNEDACEGLTDFDGETWTAYLADHCIIDIDIGPDGRVWTLATTPSGESGLFIIEPTA